MAAESQYLPYSAVVETHDFSESRSGHVNCRHGNPFSFQFLHQIPAGYAGCGGVNVGPIPHLVRCVSHSEKFWDPRMFQNMGADVIRQPSPSDALFKSGIDVFDRLTLVQNNIVEFPIFVECF